MNHCEQPTTGRRAEWRIRIAGMVGAGIGATLGLVIPALADLHWPWGFVVFLGCLVGGIVLGPLVGSLLLRRRPRG